MVQDTNLFFDARNVQSADSSKPPSLVRGQQKQGIRTHVLLVLAMALVTATVTSLFLVLLRHRLTLIA